MALEAVPESEVGHGKLSAVEAVAAITVELGAIAKANQGHGYAYRGIDDIRNALHPLLAKHGVVIAPRVQQIETVPAPGRKEGWTATRAVHEYTVHGPDGSSFLASAAADGLSNQGTGPGVAASYAYKSMVIDLFCIPTVDTPEAEQVEPAEGVERLYPPQVEQLVAVFDQIENEDTRKRVKVNWAKTWGQPAQITVDRFDAAYAAAMDAVEADTSWMGEQ